jgi:predicted NUDIX family NTP pyrophosphohydrolase
MAKKSAGILLYRQMKEWEFFLVHPGGPFFRNKDLGSWSIPKGEFEDELPLEAAIREFEEETGKKLKGRFIPLTAIKQKSGKWVHAWAIEDDLELSELKSNTFSIEWPPRSGKYSEFPEIDKAGWFTIEFAKKKILPAQCPLIEELYNRLMEPAGED